MDSIKVKRYAVISHRFRQDPHTAVHRCHLHRRPFRHILPGRTRPQKEAVATPRRPAAFINRAIDEAMERDKKKKSN